MGCVEKRPVTSLMPLLVTTLPELCVWDAGEPYVVKNEYMHNQLYEEGQMAKLFLTNGISEKHVLGHQNYVGKLKKKFLLWNAII